MTTVLATIQLSSYGLLLLLAGYLLARSRTQDLSTTIAGVLIGFALILADQFLAEAYPDQATWIGRVAWCAYPLPVALWLRVAILLLPGEALAEELPGVGVGPSGPTSYLVPSTRRLIGDPPLVSVARHQALGRKAAQRVSHRLGIEARRFGEFVDR